MSSVLACTQNSKFLHQDQAFVLGSQFDRVLAASYNNMPEKKTTLYVKVSICKKIGGQVGLFLYQVCSNKLYNVVRLEKGYVDSYDRPQK